MAPFTSAFVSRVMAAKEGSPFSRWERMSGLFLPVVKEWKVLAIRGPG
jgi:hypothetical protein